MTSYGSIPNGKHQLHAQDSVESQDEADPILSVNSTHSMKGRATLASEVISITKSLVGTGALAFSGGIALYSNDPESMASATIWIMLLGAMFAYFCVLIAKVCDKTQATTYRECWELSVGERGGMAVALMNILLPTLGDIAYGTVLSQTFQSLLQSAGIYWDRVTCLLFVTVFTLLPLCLLKNFDALAPFSVVGIIAFGVSMMAMIIRCVDGSYQPGGLYYDSIELRYQPEFGNESHDWSLQILPFVCMTFQSWGLHYNAPRFYTELKDASIPRFSQAVAVSFALSATLFAALTGAGFWTFGGNSASYILNNYSPEDPLATVSRVGVFFSTLLIYPLAFVGIRDGSLDLFKVPMERRTDQTMDRLSIVILTVLTVLSIFFHDLGLVTAVAGGAFATFMCIVFPAVMFREAVKKFPDNETNEGPEVVFAMVLMAIGVFMGVVGVGQSIVSAR